MSDAVNVHDLKTNYSKYLEQVMQGGEVLLAKNGKPVAKMVPLPRQALEPRKPGALKGQIWMSDDFDEPMMELWDIVANKKLG